jgi:coproporphyrinogen III oxidase
MLHARVDRVVAARQRVPLSTEASGVSLVLHGRVLPALPALHAAFSSTANSLHKLIAVPAVA